MVLFGADAPGFGVGDKIRSILGSHSSNLGAAFTNIFNLLMGLVGGLALIFIIVGGIQLALSTGDSKRIASAKSTILYAVVGLILAISAFAIVNFITTYVK